MAQTNGFDVIPLSISLSVLASSLSFSLKNFPRLMARRFPRTTDPILDLHQLHLGLKSFDDWTEANFSRLLERLTSLWCLSLKCPIPHLHQLYSFIKRSIQGLSNLSNLSTLTLEDTNVIKALWSDLPSHFSAHASLYSCFPGTSRNW